MEAGQSRCEPITQSCQRCCWSGSIKTSFPNSETSRVELCTPSESATLALGFSHGVVEQTVCHLGSHGETTRLRADVEGRVAVLVDVSAMVFDRAADDFGHNRGGRGTQSDRGQERKPNEGDHDCRVSSVSSRCSAVCPARFAASSLRSEALCAT